MKRTDLSEIDFSALAFPRKTKTFKTVVQLYCECRYDEAEALSAKLTGCDPQLADMRAQTAFFRSDFNECVRQGLLVYPFLDEWYSGNKRQQTRMMLEYAINKADEEVRQEAVGILNDMYHHFSEEQLAARGFEHFVYIPQLIVHATGVLESFAKPHHIYRPPESPEELSAIAEDYLRLHEKRLAALKCDPMDDPSVIRSIMPLIEYRGRPEDYLKLYNEHCTSPELNNCHFAAAKICLYFGQEDKAREALLNYARYGFIPVEFTDVKPMEIFVDYSFAPLLTKELLDAIYDPPVPEL